MCRLARVCLLTLLIPAQVSAQANITNPKVATFVASIDHAKTLPDGVEIVTGYQLDCHVLNAAGALAFSKQLGKPTPDATNTIGPVTIPEFVTLPSNQYVCTAAAVGPGGLGRSAPSSPFDSIQAPGAAGVPVLTVPPAGL